MKLNDALHKRRVELNISRAKLAKDLGYTTYQFIWNYENHRCKPPIGRGKELCKLLKFKHNLFKTLAVEDYSNLIDGIFNGND